jgi:D-glycero-D-manno-heptose 1,7-bisphosphate phosphatase
MKIVILDRDGVINFDSEGYIKSPDEWLPIPGSLEAIALLTQHGYTVTVATNQSGLARGYYDRVTLDQIHLKMKKAAAAVGGEIDGIFLCPHGPDDHCLCRKPSPGLLFEIASMYGVSLENVPFVGDSYRDILAATKANATPVLVLTGNGQKTLDKYADKIKEVPVFANLEEYAKTLVKVRD